MNLLTNKFNSFGLDIGDKSIKAAYIKQKGNDFELQSFGSIEIGEGIFDKGNIINSDQAAASIRNLIASIGPKKIKTKYAHACLPETQTFIKLLPINAQTESEIKANIREELPNHIPIDLTKSYIDSYIISKPSDYDFNVLSGVCPKKTADDYTNLLIKAGLIPVSLQIEAEAIANALIPKDLSEIIKPTAIIDIGASRSGFLLFDKGSIQFSVSIPISSNDITLEIAKKMQFTYEQAEKSKRLCGFDPSKCEKGVIDVLQNAISVLSENILKNNRFYLEHFERANPISSIILCGGGAYLPGLIEQLSSKLGKIRISYGNPLINMIKKRKKTMNQYKNQGFEAIKSENKELNNYNIPEEFSQKHELSYTTAIGLGLSNVL